ncbi:hypothetical protein QQS21_012483 [Conoideocrella luteorostrata]|uniref:EGF-like domain-containing protein n=1 Tax=Conoideocrella luteorostrata TaxID=1105319 RepID=A0AAJ0CB36_9HYPO|nr:hypothetical protein QQS21_012483 [Conoideocrella luteorostrata]
MSKPYNGKDMDRPYNTPGSVKRAREQVQAMLEREGLGTPIRAPQSTTNSADASSIPKPVQFPTGPEARPVKSRVPPGYVPKSAKVISRPTQVPQWPLANTSAPSPSSKPQQIPQRPPRPSQSRIPSMLDSSRPQQPTPVFTSRPIAPESPQDTTIDSYNVSSPSYSSARQTTSSMGTIPDFPAPAPSTTPASGRKGAILGPPPSSRRGASSFYSNASFVSPIIEESPRLKSHGSYASSAAMPETWPGGSSEAHSPGEAFYEESITEQSRESMYEEYGDESQLVRSASLGKKGKPALITTKSAGHGAAQPKNDPTPLQSISDNEAYLSAGTSSSETIPTSKKLQGPYKSTTNAESLSSDAILKAFAAASASDPKESIPLADAPNQQSRLSAMRRPPRLDIDAVRAAEARGSLTSLPDLIRRATRLASMIDKGKRPASRMDNLDGYLNEKDDRHRSGLSDMLAAFPPPVHTPLNNTGSRSSWLRSSTWPNAEGQDRPTHSRSPSGQVETKPKRRCCGMPIWAFILLVFLLLCLIVAAIVVPLEFFVFKNLGNKDKEETSLSQCQKKLTCLNGGTSVITQDQCSCICTNGFTGSTCGEGGATGCTLTNLVSTDGQSNIKNVTLGRAIPRLLANANQNYSVPLSGTTILARFNSGNLSCIAQNSLVTFDGRATRSGQPTDEVEDVSVTQANLILNAENFPPVSIITFTPTTTTTITVPKGGGQYGQMTTTAATATASLPPEITRTSATSRPFSTSAQEMLPTTLIIDTGSVVPSNPIPGSTPTPVPAAFKVTEEKIDFARVAMLYILQEGTVDKAIAAQAELQRLFSRVTTAKTQQGAGVTQHEASNVDLGNGNSINLVDLSVNVGRGPVGCKSMKRESSTGVSTSYA